LLELVNADGPKSLSYRLDLKHNSQVQGIPILLNTMCSMDGQHFPWIFRAGPLFVYLLDPTICRPSAQRLRRTRCGESRWPL